MTDHLSSFLSMIIFACAPAWGATPYEYFQVYPVFISTHAPAWGATWLANGKVVLWCISTHAPAWGATWMPLPEPPEVEISTHAPAWGATMGAAVKGYLSLFLLTPPRGGRRILLGRCRFDSHYFYSRPRVGGDDHDPPEERVGIHFYSRPRVGGDWRHPAGWPWVTYFYSRPRVGGDRQAHPGGGRQLSFLLTPPRGGRLGAGRR